LSRADRDARHRWAGGAVWLALAIAGILVPGLREAHAAGVLTVCTEASPDGFDIAQFTAAATADAVGATVYDQLLRYQRGSADTEPALADRVEVSPDGLQYTVHLRAGVKFQTTPWFKPTREMNADDVMFSIRRLMDPKSPWLAIAKNGFVAWASYGPGEAVKALDKLDDMTVRFTLKEPNAPFMQQLAQSNVASVYSAEYGAQLLKSGQLEKINTEPVGTGPWQLRSYQKDAVLRLAAHPGYWGGAQKIGTLIFAITPDASVRVQRLKAGECLVGSNLRAETIGSLAGSKVDVLATTALMTGYIPLNTQRKFLSDKRFREALWLAFDKATFIQSVYGGRAQAAASFLPPTVWGHDASLKDRHDPERAKALVKASGYDGTELEIATRIGGSIDGKRAAELMQADWAKVGVKVRVQMVEWGEMIKRMSRGNYDISFLNWIGSADPDAFFTPMLTCAAQKGGNNDPQWCNPAFDDLLLQARRSNDRAQRTVLYRRAQRMVYDEVPLIPTVYPQYFTAVNRKVKGFKAGPLADLDFRGVSIDEP
jgi:dipeptide transport system substrate-binding protein